MHAKHLAECLVPGKNSMDIISDADTDDGDDDGDDDDGGSDSCKGSSHSLEIHYSLPLCSSIYFH